MSKVVPLRGLTLVKTDEPPREVSYKDFLHRRSGTWRIERTPKAAGDLEMTSKGFDRHG